jgi:drug/metabolite transporter (DMT)-like permease
MFKTILLVFLYVAFGAIGQVVVSAGMKQKVTSLPYVIVGTTILAAGYAVYLVLLKDVPLSVVVPAGAGSFMLITAMARIFLHEEIPPLRWIGAVVVSIGVAIVMYSDMKMRRSVTKPAPPVAEQRISHDPYVTLNGAASAPVLQQAARE